jgi:hypothetical protein
LDYLKSEVKVWPLLLYHNWMKCVIDDCGINFIFTVFSILAFEKVIRKDFLKDSGDTYDDSLMKFPEV